MLRFVPPQELRALWPWVRVGLEQIKTKCGEPWIPEEIYCQIQAKTAFLYVFDKTGFAVFQKHFDGDGPVLFIWLLWCKSGLGLPIEQQLYAAIDQLATKEGCKRIRMHSPRKGWAQRGFFVPVSTIYEREM